MGVLDDAIREHLELKRQHGARDSEIKELEDEAFGPPSRPGEPDFPARETGEDGAVATDAPPEALVGDETAAEHEVVPPPPEAEVVPPPEPEAEEATQLMDTSTEPVAEAPAAPIEEVPAEEPDPSRKITGSRGFYDHEAEPAEPAEEAEEGDLGVEDLDLNLDETDEVVAAPEPPPIPEAEEPAPPQAEPEEPEDDSLTTMGLPTEEHPFEDEVVDEVVVEEDSDALELEEDSGELTLEPDTGTGEEDVLEETPEFLREKPEDEELWFEQGEPKDFDFEDEDDE